MKTKNVIMMIFVFVIGFCLSGCEKSSCTINVISSYGGFGEGGQDLGSGSFSDSFTVSVGDKLYEDFNGHWKRESKNKNEAIIITIEEITDNGVTIKNDDEEITMQYDCPQKIRSRYMVDDGLNYGYSISFSQDNE